ncbi:MAG: tetratricopeptide repeat protein [Gluconobacter potus]|uniref:Sel1 repeat family protein n=1 Tax=Gluconobacter potus TaxID=2724927 RepID=A0ABR9YIA8_9PROT|nr:MULTISPECIES: tetratricopeptide repeat protein [Gluconobacter]MBF0863512.1 sel1 repeat family protein [Gluconobacter sp. R71656]MBF0866319.1 sel1 repeat family protein [Gluconobacter sp. R75628]MBF0872553.1 sel1 repeat family protein [Gluconobacter sp. R75629]MBF0881519.1 sel1 repeat family protein [Gluconobacter potus]
MSSVSGAHQDNGISRPAPLPVPEQVKAQLILAQTHLDAGRREDAFSCFGIAARSGHPVALNMLGRAYERGWGVKRNPAMAARCFETAIEGGDGWAMFNLADLFLAGDGVPKNTQRAYRLYVDAARTGNAKALNMLGIMHEDGSVPAGEPDPDTAHQFYQAAAEGGDCWAWLNLARLALERGVWSEAALGLEKALDCAIVGVPDAVLALIRPHAQERVFQAVMIRCLALLEAQAARGVSHAA